MAKPIATATLLQFAAVLAALASVLGLLAVERREPPPAGIERVKSLIAVQVESLSRRR